MFNISDALKSKIKSYCKFLTQCGINEFKNLLVVILLFSKSRYWLYNMQSGAECTSMLNVAVVFTGVAGVVVVLLGAWYQCRKRKTEKREVQRFVEDIISKLLTVLVVTLSYL